LTIHDETDVSGAEVEADVTSCGVLAGGVVALYTATALGI